MSNGTILKDAGEIDLTRHGVIEAHAGAGKTHTIVEMVLRILLEPVATVNGEPAFNHIRNLLLVTFTEKAAGELKKRIRQGIEKRIAELLPDGSVTSPGLKQHLEDCLNNLHESFIGTIHGVCLRLLQTWPFETGVHFKTEITDDAEGLADALRESVRTDWQDEKTLIPWALERLQAQGMHLSKKHFSLVCEIAETLLDKDNTVLDRRSCENFRLGSLKTLFDKEFLAHLPDFMKRVEQIKNFLDGFAPDGAFHENAKTAVASARTWAGKVLAGTVPISREAVASLSKFKKPDRNGVMRPCAICDAAFKKTVQGSELGNLFESLQNHPCISSLTAIERNLPLTLLCDAAELLRDRWANTKQEKGLVSFQDMLRFMCKAVTGNPRFCTALRRRLRYGIIDEFQDTSILQWKIFKLLFLETPEENGPRLFIVGDPKQSIFAFQGADVQSYVDAKSAIEREKGRVYGLIHNYRSLPETIAGCNAILKPNKDGDWFAFDTAAPGRGAISYPSDTEGGALAQAPEGRTARPGGELPYKPVQIMALEGNAPRRLADMAKWASVVIRSLTGKTISVPKGLEWEAVTLEYRHFAVIVEKHRFAVPFLERFQADGIPAAKYKMEGVFQSPMARDLHALLRAVVHPAGDPAPRLAALLTRFFNRHPAAIKPELDLEPCAKPRIECNRGGSCIFHALEEWAFLASQQLWSQLFWSIHERTRVRERLVRLVDGERHLADLRQVSDYCIEQLYRGAVSLEQLVERLGRLLAEEESAGRDRNLFMLATDKSSVRVLTVHAAKGLQFPVVFAVTGGSESSRKGMGTLCWIENHAQRVMPALSFGRDLLKDLFDEEETSIPPVLQRRQERRRRLYVALTRAQAMLFVPAHLHGEPDRGNRAASWAKRPLPPNPDDDLTPRLLQLLDDKDLERKYIDLFDGGRWKTGPAEKTNEPLDHLDPAWVPPPSAEAASDEMEKRMQALDLPGRICRQTSYTELSREADSDRATDHGEEEDETEPAGASNAPPPFLPGGRQTGDALHRAIEELLGTDDVKSLPTDTQPVYTVVRKYLDGNGVLRGLKHETEYTRAVEAGVEYVNGALTTSLPLPGGGTVTIADLKCGDRIPEMEFFLGVSPHWVHGYMDLVFRLENGNALHPWRYFVLDWKSDRLEQFDGQRLEAFIHERHYDLQSKIYCHALDKYLGGILGAAYDPTQNLGGAVYVFLRGFGTEAPKGQCRTWIRRANPKEDSKFTQDQLDNLIVKRSGRA